MKVPLKKDQKVKVAASHDVHKIMQDILLRENKLRRKQEYFWTVGLSTSSKIEYIELIALGKLNTVSVRPVELFSFAVQKRCDRLILVHNHPRGGTTPSKDDKDLTDRIKNAAAIIEITIVDHIIITEKDYNSFKDNNLLGD